jgi:hypothetical protein
MTPVLDPFGCTLGIYYKQKIKTKQVMLIISWSQVCQFKQEAYVVDAQHIIVTISVLDTSYCVWPVFFLQDKYTQVIHTNCTIPTLILKLYDLKE